ncbi:RICIN domain-containing protein [Simiduia curdlanivorans]|uniref:RICIN domain-containing protein n=1 Tax=Simiduia curdlanivorans TaxID=1492769 RepID=UPI0025B2C524|nr:RICIN domain-containing protein [Simiduia curdlanivorans]MDN3637539.1 RICIN domain-containing protein [Simiduia curdlanivorans]
MNYKNLFALLAISAFASTANAATFVIEKYGTGFSIDGNGGAIQGQQIYLWGTNTSNVNQKWVQLDRGDGYYAYKKEGTNLCWDGGNGGSKRQAITLQTCDTNNYNQHFSKVKIYAGTEVYRIKKRGVSYSLDWTAIMAQLVVRPSTSGIRLIAT